MISLGMQEPGTLTGAAPLLFQKYCGFSLAQRLGG
jgi:hypothetical protein